MVCTFSLLVRQWPWLRCCCSSPWDAMCDWSIPGRRCVWGHVHAGAAPPAFDVYSYASFLWLRPLFSAVAAVLRLSLFHVLLSPLPLSPIRCDTAFVLPHLLPITNTFHSFFASVCVCLCVCVSVCVCVCLCVHPEGGRSGPRQTQSVSPVHDPEASQTVLSFSAPPLPKPLHSPPSPLLHPFASPSQSEAHLTPQRPPLSLFLCSSCFIRSRQEEGRRGRGGRRRIPCP